MPKSATGKIPVVLIIADAGPTDRDGNNVKTGVSAFTYKLLANALGKNGVATLRYDKRLVGESVSTTKENQLRIDDYSDDAVSLINMLNEDQRFSKIILFGHGQGALIAEVAQYDEPVKAFVAAEWNADRGEKILTDEVNARSKFLADEFKVIMDSLKKGKTTQNVDPSLYFIASPSMQPFIMSWCRIDLIKGLKKIKIPVMIIQGTTDLILPVANGEKFKKAKSDVNLLIVKGMNHQLRDAPSDEEKNLATYGNPDLPLKPEMVSGMVDFINKLK